MSLGCVRFDRDECVLVKHSILDELPFLVFVRLIVLFTSALIPIYNVPIGLPACRFSISIDDLCMTIRQSVLGSESKDMSIKDPPRRFRRLYTLGEPLTA
jgi:hypothetical protein